MLFAILKKVLIIFILNLDKCKACIFKRVLKQIKNKKYKILQQRQDKCARFKDLDIRLKTLGKKLSVNNNLT